MNLSFYIKTCYSELPILKDYALPWDVISNMNQIIEEILPSLSESEFTIKDNIAIHKLAIIEENVIIKKNTIINEGCVVKSGAYIRDGVFLAKNVNIGANCEIKQSIIFNKSRIAHLNYVGNSIIGTDVNLEAGSVLANHFNEFKNKNIQVVIDNSIIDTKVLKFGSLLGDSSRIGANSVLNPGTILNKNSIIERLTHINQLQNSNF